VTGRCSGVTAHRTSARPRNRCSPRPTVSASAGCPTTGPGTAVSTRNPGRDLASAGTDIAAIADDLGIDRFAVVGHSGGGSHALAAAALLGDRVTGVVSMAGLAPFTADGLDWYAGMIPSGEASLRAAAAGPAAKDRHEASDVEYDPEFTPADLAALAGPWSWLGGVAGAGMASGPGGLIDDDLAYVNPWGSDPTGIVAPTLLLHGGRDGIVPSAHGAWLAAHCPTAEWWFRPDDGHISVLNAAAPALDWLIEHG